MSNALLLFRHRLLSLQLSRMYVTCDFSQNTLEHLKAKITPPGHGILTMTKIKETLNERLGATTWLDRDTRIKQAPADQSNMAKTELIPRDMAKSFTCAVIPLSKDHFLQEKYVTFLGHVRLGRLMEDLDKFAVWVASNHLVEPGQDGQRLFGNIVTLLVDSIDFAESRIQPKCDIRVSGFVSWCGNSTIETEIWMEQETANDEWKIITNARFLMALRDPFTGKAARVNQLVTSDPFEQKLLEQANERRKYKKAEADSSLYHVGPKPSEIKVLHQLMYEDIIDGIPFQPEQSEGAILLEKAGLSNTVFSHPEDRNIYNTVFGGYLMRKALELSWACTWLHTHQRPQLVRIGDIRFHRPVNVASLLRMRSFIIYTEGNQAIVKVTAFIHEPETGDTFRTNDFHFTYKMENSAPKILPRSYESGLMYLEGRRRFMELRHDQNE